MVNIEKIDKMMVILREMKRDYKRLDKLSDKDLTEMTPRQAEKRNVDASWIGMENIKRRHELHALAVELGFAERRDSYDDVDLTDGWHHYKFKPPEPFAQSNES